MIPDTVLIFIGDIERMIESARQPTRTAETAKNWVTDLTNLEEITPAEETKLKTRIDEVLAAVLVGKPVPPWPSQDGDKT